MVQELDKRVGRIFQHYNNVRRAEITRNSKLLRRSLADGLAESCSLLQEIMEDKTLRSLASERKALQMLKAKRGKLDGFLKAEGELLKRTKLKSDAIDSLLDAVKVVVKSGQRKTGDWRESLRQFARVVCDEAEKVKKAQRAK